MIFHAAPVTTGFAVRRPSNNANYTCHSPSSKLCHSSVITASLDMLSVPARDHSKCSQLPWRSGFSCQFILFDDFFSLHSSSAGICWFYIRYSGGDSSTVKWHIQHEWLSAPNEFKQSMNTPKKKRKSLEIGGIVHLRCYIKYITIAASLLLTSVALWFFYLYDFGWYHAL